MVTLKPGDKAPVFAGPDQDGKKITAARFRGKKIVLYFYPADMTPTCTVQACNLRDNYTLLKAAGFEIIGVSPDPVENHKKFEEKFALPFPLIADPDHTIIDQYGVWDKKLLYGREYMGLLRTTFVIDEKGIIRLIFTKPKSKKHAEEILDAWKDLAK